MDNGYTKQVRERISMAEDGTVFATSDFADIADTTSIRQSLKRLVENGILRRILRGIFEKRAHPKGAVLAVCRRAGNILQDSGYGKKTADSGGNGSVRYPIPISGS